MCCKGLQTLRFVLRSSKELKCLASLQAIYCSFVRCFGTLEPLYSGRFFSYRPFPKAVSSSIILNIEAKLSFLCNLIYGHIIYSPMLIYKFLLVPPGYLLLSLLPPTTLINNHNRNQLVVMTMRLGNEHPHTGKKE